MKITKNIGVTLLTMGLVAILASYILAGLEVSNMLVGTDIDLLNLISISSSYIGLPLSFIGAVIYALSTDALNAQPA